MEKIFMNIIEQIKKRPVVPELWHDAFECIKLLYRDGEKTGDYSVAFSCNERYRKMLLRLFSVAEDPLRKEFDPFLRETYHLEAKEKFDSYMLYLEWGRPPEKKFYAPRRKVLRSLVQDFQDLEDDVIEFLGVSMPPRTGKSTLCDFFFSWIIGKHPDGSSVMAGHSNVLVKGFYNEVKSIISDSDTYNWDKVFPGLPVVKKSDVEYYFDVGVEKERFHNLTCRSVSGTLTGAVEYGRGGYLLSDDLVRDYEESVNLDRLDSKYEMYLNQLKDRKLDGAKEIMIGTRWNVFDPLGRVHEQYATDPRHRFVVIPAVNEKGESNFMYDYRKGFSTSYYKDMKASISEDMWAAKYMGNPFVREGLLFPATSLKYFSGNVPPDPDRRIAVCDVAWGGGDFLAMPIAYIYGDDAYIVDVVYNRSGKNVTQPLVAAKLERWDVAEAQFEANNGGTEYCDSVSEICRENFFRCRMSAKSAPSNTSKMNRIVQYSDNIIKNFYFLEYKARHSEYTAFMDSVTLFTVSGKNKHDDAPDSLAMLAALLNSGIKKATAFKRPF